MGVLSFVTGCATFVLPETADKKMPQTLQDVYGLYSKNYKKVHLSEGENGITCNDVGLQGKDKSQERDC